MKVYRLYWYRSCLDLSMTKPAKNSKLAWIQQLGVCTSRNQKKIRTQISERGKALILPLPLTIPGRSSVNLTICCTPNHCRLSRNPSDDYKLSRSSPSPLFVSTFGKSRSTRLLPKRNIYATTWMPTVSPTTRLLHCTTTKKSAWKSLMYATPLPLIWPKIGRAHV